MTNNKIIFFSLSLIVSLTIGIYLSKIPKPLTLRVLTYSSFAGMYGPGRKIKPQFESFCQCKVEWFLVEDSTALLQRFSLISQIDLVIGWDQITLISSGTALWEDLSSLKKDLIKKENVFEKEDFFKNPYFLPLNWSPIGLIYRKDSTTHPLKNNIDGSPSERSLKSLSQINGKISFPEPSSSTLGLQFYYWIYEVFKGDKKDLSSFLKTLKDKIYGPVFSWSLAYGFFQKGKTVAGLSYLSSLIYHQKEEKKKSYFFATFKEGHPYQVEFISISKKATNKALAKQFVTFLLSKEIQEDIRNTHYMFPMAKNLAPHPLIKTYNINFISYKQLNEFIDKKDELLKLWGDIFY